MKTRYLITTTNPDAIDPEGFDDDRTNTPVFLLEIKCLKRGQGKLR